MDIHPGVAIGAALAGVFTLAMVAVLVSKNAATGTVVQQAGSALTSVIGAATAPVTGGSTGGGGAALGNSLASTGFGSLVTALGG